MKILGIESSCDETSAAIIENGTTILANVIATSQDIQAKYGGIVPEVAARKQADYIIPVLKEVFEKAQLDKDKIDAIAVTVGPGLVGSLLVGLETAKTLSYIWNKPLIPVNHLVGHIYSGWLDASTKQKPRFPLLALIASGGHTELVLMQGHEKLEKIGSTLDDAVGEAFDKVARIIKLGYPGGPAIEKAALTGDIKAFDFPRPMINSSDHNFSYSGLKTSVLYKVKSLEKISNEQKNDLAASFQQSALEVLIEKTFLAAGKHQVKSVLITGGVAANQYLKKLAHEAVEKHNLNLTLHIPPIELATDNASYIAAAGYFQNKNTLDPSVNIEKIMALQPNPNLSVADNPISS